MKIAVIIVRLLVGALFLFASLAYFFQLIPQPPLTGKTKIFMEGVAAAIYLMPLIKVTELICAIAFVTGRFVTLATVVIFPITLNIALYHIFVGTEGLPMAIALFLGNLFLAYAYRENYRNLFVAK